MTAQLTRPARDTRPSRWRRPFWTAARHYLEMVVAMVVGMLLLDPVWDTAAVVAGVATVLARPDVGAVVMATNMTVGMTVWMRHRGHRWMPVAEMAAAMYVPFLVLLVPYWTGLVDGETLLMGGHLLMLPAMAVAMLLRRREYTTHHHRVTAPTSADTAVGTPLRRLAAVLVRRWPTWLALLVTVDSWVDPGIPAPALLVGPAAYVVIGAVRRQFHDRRILALQLGGLLAYVALVLVAVSVDDGLAKYVIAGGWLAHAAWDLAHHRARAVVPRPLAEWCAVVDAVIGITILVLLP